MNYTEAYQEVRQSAKEFAYQWAWAKHEKRENKCLGVSRMFLETAIAQFKVVARRAKV